MKKLLLILSIFILLISCDLSLLKRGGEFKETIISDENKDIIKFLLLSDLHLGRSVEDKGVTDYSEAILSYIDKDEYDFALLCGDLVDTSRQNDKAAKFISELKAKIGNENVLYALGNHELHYSDKEGWLNYNFNDLDHNLYHKYSYDGLSIYKLDSADRAIGIGQFEAFENALKADKNQFKLIFTHVPISGKSTEMTAVQFTLADAAERNKLILLMDKYDIGLYLSGHHHIGNYEEHFSQTSGEFIVAAAHHRDFNDLESEGFYYEGILDKTHKVLVIRGYKAKDNSLATTFYFNMP